jgi:hypothetical protein
MAVWQNLVKLGRKELRNEIRKIEEWILEKRKPPAVNIASGWFSSCPVRGRT